MAKPADIVCAVRTLWEAYERWCPGAFTGNAKILPDTHNSISVVVQLQLGFPLSKPSAGAARMLAKQVLLDNGWALYDYEDGQLHTGFKANPMNYEELLAEAPKPVFPDTCNSGAPAPVDPETVRTRPL